jgi:hypothetical protein
VAGESLPRIYQCYLPTLALGSKTWGLGFFDQITYPAKDLGHASLMSETHLSETSDDLLLVFGHLILSVNTWAEF